MRLLIIVAMLAVLGPSGASAQEPVATLADGRSGKIQFESLTPSGHFQLIRKQVTTKTTIFGTLKLPAGTARGPAMIISHGSGGVSDAREFLWADRLVEWGIAAFVVDSFTPRGIKETATDQSQVHTSANVADALHALKLLATHPRIDPQRIGVIGFSKGGQVALYTALEPFRRSVIADDTRFAAHVPLYPYCNEWYVTEHPSGTPVLMLLGGKDDYTPPAPCVSYADWLKGKGVETQVITYADAYHGFEANRGPTFNRDVVTARNCDMVVDIDRFTVKVRTTGADISQDVRGYMRSCTGKGATIGGDSEARRRAPEDVRGFLKQVFKL